MTEASKAADRPTRITDPEVMRVLAHPARLAVLEHLGSTGGEITATEAAALVGLSPSATSYHLRALAKVGIIKDAPSRGDGRERVYRGTFDRQWIVGSDQDADEETKLAEDRLLDAFLARSEARLQAWRRNAPEEPKEWFDVAMMTETILLMTADELVELTEKLVEAVRPYRRGARLENAPEGARPVAVQIRALPQ